MQRDNRQIRIEAGKIKLTLTILVVIAAAIVLYIFYGRSTRHVFHADNAPFSERLIEPASFVYGSSIHVWAYQRPDGGPSQVFVTGHADGETCREMTGLVFNAYLEKGDDPNDLFVAGAARLSAGDQGIDSNDPRLKKYIELLRQYNLDKFVLSIVEHQPTEGSDSESALQQAKHRIDEDEKTLKAAEADQVVAKFANRAKSTTALGSFLHEANNIAQDSGLVQVHTLPSDLATEVRQRIENAAKSAAPSITRFDDLLATHHVSEAVVLVDMLRRGSAQPVEIHIPLNDLSVDGFEEAKKLNRSEVESSMVGDAARRKQFYQDQEAKIRQEFEQCRRATPKQLSKEIQLTEECSPDGFCSKSDHPVKMTDGEYCSKRVPQNLEIVKSWMGGVDTLLKSIQEDRDRPSDSRIEAMNHATLIDSMLRDWRLPVARSQEAFDFWRKRRRGSAWSAIDVELRKANIEPGVLKGEQIVFSVRVSGRELVIHPILIVDLARSAVAADGKTGAIRVIDAWGARRAVPQDQGTVKDARTLTLKAIDQASKGEANDARGLLVHALTLQPAVGFDAIQEGWNSLFVNDSGLRAQLGAKARGRETRQERLATIHEIFSSPDLKDDPKKFVQRLSSALEADPGLPVDLHMRLAMDVSTGIAQASQVLIAKGEHGTVSTPWQIIQAALSDSKMDTRSDELLDKACSLFQEVYEIDPDKVLRQSITIVHQRAPQYLEIARHEHGMPKQPSSEMQSLVKAQEVGMLEWEAVELDGVQNQLTRRLHAVTAAEMLWANKEPNLGAVRRELEQAQLKDTGATTPAFKAAADRLNEFTKSQNRPDTLARMEIGQIISNGSTELLLRAAQRMKNPKTAFTDSLSSHHALEARIAFEQNKYALAYNTLIPDMIPVALYAPGETWAADRSDWSGSADKVTAVCSNGTVSVRARKGVQESEVLKISGLLDPDCTALAQEIDKRWSPAPIGKVSEQVLATKVPLRQDAQRVRQLLMDSTVRLALLKAMVFADVPPADTLIPSPHSPMQIDHKDLMKYEVPTLEQIVQNASKTVQ